METDNRQRNGHNAQTSGRRPAERYSEDRRTTERRSEERRTSERRTSGGSSQNRRPSEDYRQSTGGRDRQTQSSRPQNRRPSENYRQGAGERNRHTQDSRPQNRRPVREYPQGRELPEDERKRRQIEDSRRKRAYMAKKRKQKERLIRLISVLVVLLILLIAFFFFNNVRSRVYVEINQGPVDEQDFAVFGFMKCKAVSGFDEIDYTKVGEYPVTLKSCGIKHTSKVIVEDKTPPVVLGQDVKSALGNEVGAEQFVASVTDDSNVTIKYDKNPKFNKSGSQDVKIVVTDESGNSVKLTQKLTLYEDTEPPVITGVHDINAYLGDGISYKEGITVTDNISTDIQLQVDNSQVNLNEAGTYTITYQATDDAGNTTTASAVLTLEEKPEGYVEPEEVMALANDVLDEILTDDMTEGEKLTAIYDWCHRGIGYVQSDYKESWTGGAYIGLTQRSGDCYIFFSTAKALLTAAGFENVDVVKQDTSHSRHYWSMVNTSQGWYHFDTTNFRSGARFCLVTDAELDEYSHSHQESHNRDKSLYPATSTEDYQFE